MTYYEVLELDESASKEDIERAFRKLARQVHPDLNSGDPSKAEARMKQLNEIRDTLTDPLLRAGYDERLRLEALRRGREAPPRPASPPPSATTTTTAAAASTSAPRQHPLGEPGPTAPPSSWRIVLGVVVGGAGAAAILLLAPGDAPSPVSPRTETFVADAAAPPVLSVPTTARVRGPAHAGEAAFRPAHARPRGKAQVRLGSTADEVLAAFGTPDRIQAGPRAGEATFFYGALRLEMKNGRVTGGDAAVLR